MLKPVTSLLLALAALPASAIPVGLSTTDLSWGGITGAPSSALTLHIEDLLDPSPTTTKLQLTFTGHVEQDYPFAYTEFETIILTRSRPRTLLDLEVLDNSIHDGIVLEGGSYLYYEVGYSQLDDREGLPSLLDWTSTVVLTLEGFDTSETLSFTNSVLTAYCTSLESCPWRRINRGVQFVELTELTAVPESSTGALVGLGLMTLGWLRRARGCEVTNK